MYLLDDRQETNRLTHGMALEDDVYLDALRDLITDLTESSLRRNTLLNAADRDDTCLGNLYEMHKSAVYKDAKFLMLR